ncbi:MAG: UPF0175 family protein [Candidatus Aminicenantes bacterium]
MMNQVEIKLEVPEFLVGTADIDKNELGEYVRQTIAVELYREGKLSLGKSKELAGLSNKWENMGSGKLFSIFSKHLSLTNFI